MDFQPWRCLCRFSEQITYTTPRRRTILQWRQIFFTEAWTFIVSSSLSPDAPGNHKRPTRHAVTYDYLTTPERPYPFRLAFFNRLSYWCDIKCACTWDMKSMTTTTIISSEVPPK